MTQNWPNNKDDKNVILLKLWMKDNENRKKDNDDHLFMNVKIRIFTYFPTLAAK